LENTKEVVAKFKRRLNIEVKRQERLNIVEKQHFRRRELLEILFLSLLPIFCMVVLKRELANKIFSTYTSSTINHIVSNTVYEDINMDALRERSAISSSNISMVSSTHSAASFILYHARMEQQSSNPT